MAPQADLVKVGLEGFAILEELIRGQKKRPSAPPGSQRHHLQPPEQPHHVPYEAQAPPPAKKAVMVKPPHLVKIGLEGFAIVEEYYVKTSRRPPPPPPHAEPQYRYPYQQQPPYIYRRTTQVPQKKEAVIDYNQAAQLYGGVVIKDGSKMSNKKPLSKAFY
ncbi:hypothetical protein F0562_000650 [Nyssa sinensis]|uniref:Uncharacterized protein n=1 Tax=Nyssa sinensis TaxID=561372 RepID=A0A5J5C252_9ASTE|nr:hypothetical protein F0562_000650 [Nyssa sinensis]